MKKLMLGNEAIARAAHEAGVRLVSSYPGTPSTEITEKIASDYPGIYCEWAPNEKVAMEVAIGASIAGARAMCAQKHVGLNVAADPLFTVSYTGVNGGLVIVVADDPGMHSSQNEQDSRHYAKAAKVLMLEPSDSAECLEFTKDAFSLSEKYDTPVIIRLSTRISHSQSIVFEGAKQDVELKDFDKNFKKYVMMPQMAKARHAIVEKRQAELSELADKCKYNNIELNNSKIGVITSGIAYQYAKEALGGKVSYLKLGMVNPLPRELILEFAKKVDKIYVIEELDDIIESHCRAIGVNAAGKEVFTFLGEYSPELIKKVILNKSADMFEPGQDIPNRPPVLCPGCPHRGVFYTFNKLRLNVTGDIGCYTLGALAPLNAIDACVDMGASIGMLHGINKVRSDSFNENVAVIGDSTFMHSGITGLINIFYNNSFSTVCILDNSITAMTGHQQNPTTGSDIKNASAPHVDIEALCRGIGIKNIVTVDPYDLEEFEKALKTQLNKKEPSVVIAKRPCVLLKSVKTSPAYKINKEKCTGCKMCKKIGCPSISVDNKKAAIDAATCVGCGLCVSLCKFGAITAGGTV